MNEIILKRKLAEATQRVVKSRDADVEGLGLVCAAIGDLLGAWTGQEVRVLIYTEGQSVDMTKSADARKLWPTKNFALEN